MHCWFLEYTEIYFLKVNFFAVLSSCRKQTWNLVCSVTMKKPGVRILPHISLEELMNSEACVKRADVHFPRAPNRDCGRGFLAWYLHMWVTVHGREEGKARWELGFVWTLFCISCFQMLISGLIFLNAAFFMPSVLWDHSAVWKKHPNNPVSYCYCVILSLEKNNQPFSLALFTFFSTQEM